MGDATRRLRIEEGFKSDQPSVVGKYLMACEETCYDIAIVSIKDIDGSLFVIDNEVGTMHIDNYDLTNLLWLRIETH